ncbi:uncharacterized protein [Nicotiana sylvestris]|uniref:uncharacterized protein n=1 Tax=Nicotiana sylvestris TaxID=4096 RepID=UPI00388CC503
MSTDTEDSTPTTGDPIEGFTDIHTRNPLYLHPYDILGCILVAQRLTGIENYIAWSNSMKVALLSGNKLGFIDGSFRKEHYRGDLVYELDRCNAFVLSWIANSISRELGNGLMYSSNAHKVWMDLKECFDKRNLT